MQNQIYTYLNKIFSRHQCGFRKAFGAQHCLIAIIEKWRQSLDSSRQAAAVLLKFFGCTDNKNENEPKNIYIGNFSLDTKIDDLYELIWFKINQIPQRNM